MVGGRDSKRYATPRCPQFLAVRPGREGLATPAAQLEAPARDRSRAWYRPAMRRGWAWATGAAAAAVVASGCGGAGGDGGSCELAASTQGAVAWSHDGAPA